MAATIGTYVSARLGLLSRVSADLPRFLGRPPRGVAEYARDHRRVLNGG